MYDLEKIKETLKNYFKKSKRKIFIEYILFQGLNDSLQDARKLSEYLKSIGHSYLLHVNLISYNAEYETTDEFKASSKNNTIKFKNCLQQNHINVTIRKSLGEEIQGACGQLVAH
jgi:23S rRNA (adenine2503-C2)-methyltransferase